MEGLKIHQIQYYRVYAESDLKRIVIDGYTNYTYNKECQYVKYEFDLSKCVRLDQFLQSASLYMIKGGQALSIMQRIMEKCDHIQKQGSCHKNLTSDKVWLVLRNGSEQLKFVFSEFLDFDIHFTGYVEGEDSIEYDDKMMCKRVLLDILNNFDKFQRSDNKKQVNGVSINSIKQCLLSQLKENISIKWFQKSISDILQKYGYSNYAQTLKGIDSDQYPNSIFNFSPRYREKESLLGEIAQIQVTYLQDTQTKFEQRQKQLELMQSQLDFNSYFYCFYAQEVAKNIGSRPQVAKNKKEYSSFQLIEISQFYQYQMLQQYQKLVGQMDQALNQNFKFGSIITNNELGELILEQIQITELQICNSIESFNLYKNKKYIFTKQFHTYLAQKIKDLHKNIIIKQWSQLIENLQ